MSFLLLTKGLEEEVYTGTADGTIVGRSHEIATALEGFSTEPDRRNVEFTTQPLRSYDELLAALRERRCQLRRYLRDHGNHTLIPGGTMSLGDSKPFQISK
jgi:predicted glutamate--cysteine ligase